MTEITEYKEVTPQDILDAAEANGYRWGRNGWFDNPGTFESSPITEACVLGQVALNLEISHTALGNYLSSLRLEKKYKNIRVLNVYGITYFNDDPSLGIKTYDQLVKRFRALMKPHMKARPLRVRVVKRFAKKVEEL